MVDSAYFKCGHMRTEKNTYVNKSNGVERCRPCHKKAMRLSMSKYRESIKKRQEQLAWRFIYDSYARLCGGF